MFCHSCISSDKSPGYLGNTSVNKSFKWGVVTNTQTTGGQFHCDVFSESSNDKDRDIVRTTRDIIGHVVTL